MKKGEVGNRRTCIYIYVWLHHVVRSTLILLFLASFSPLFFILSGEKIVATKVQTNNKNSTKTAPVFRDALFLRHPLSFVGEKGSGSEARLLFSSSPSLYNIHSRSQKVETSKIILFYRDDAPFTASFNLEIDERAGNKQIVEKRVKRE